MATDGVWENAAENGYQIKPDQPRAGDARSFPRLYGKGPLTARRMAVGWDVVFSVILGATQLALTVYVYTNSVNYASDLGLTNVMIVLLACSCYRFLIHLIGPFIREDSILWNRFFGRMIFPNVATIAIWFILLMPPTLLVNSLNALAVFAASNSNSSTPVSLQLPTHGTTFLIPTTDFILLTVSMLV